MREIPFGANAEALDFADRLLAGRFDIVIFLTGVGTRFLAQAIETRHDRETWTAALADTKVVVRGPKPLVPLRELKVRVDVQAPEPNTWHEVLAVLDAELPVAGQRVAVQEYGKSNPDLIAGLQSRGADVLRVPVYRWAFPEDTAPCARPSPRWPRGPGGHRDCSPRLSRWMLTHAPPLFQNRMVNPKTSLPSPEKPSPRNTPSRSFTNVTRLGRSWSVEKRQPRLTSMICRCELKGGGGGGRIWGYGLVY